jgi:hypothetical protein
MGGAGEGNSSRDTHIHRRGPSGMDRTQLRKACFALTQGSPLARVRRSAGGDGQSNRTRIGGLAGELGEIARNKAAQVAALKFVTGMKRPLP